MEAWQVFDASTAELLTQLDLLGSPSSGASRLTALIHQELVERGHLNQFLSNLGVLQDETGLKPALLLQHVPETFTQQAQERQTSSDRPPIDLAPDNIRPKHVHKYQAQLDLFTATASNASHSTAADIETLTAQRSWDLNNADAVEVAAPPAISVLDAAVAAYKQEKRRLWKAKKAGAQAGWGFTKPHPSCPRPDKSAAAALGSLCSSSTAVRQGSTSLMQQTASCHAPSARPPAMQTVQRVQQAEAPQSTADETSSGLSQTLSGSSVSAAHQVALPKLATAGVMPDKQQQQQQQQQPAYSSCENHIDTVTAEAPCTSASGSVVGQPHPLQQLQHNEAGASQEHGCGSIADAESPHVIAAEAEQNCTSAESPSERVPAATVQQIDVVHICQQSGLLSNQMYICAQLEASHIPEAPSQPSSDVHAGGGLQQHADSCASACGHMKQRQYVGSTSGLSSCDSECSQTAEPDAVATEYDKQACCQLDVSDGMPTSSWVHRPSLSDHVSEACSESSEADMASIGEATWQEAAMAPFAHHLQQPQTAHRLNEWNMPGNEGLCSWPTSPLHDPFNVAARPHMSQGLSRTQNFHLAGMHQSSAKGKTDQADRLITFANGERMIVS